MDIEEALDWFARYGNVARDADLLRETRPTMAALQEAARVAVTRYKRDVIEGIDAIDAIQNYWYQKDGVPLR
jgi:hypothetical protein